MSKGSTRRPGKIISQTAWERIFTKPQPICGLCQMPIENCGCAPTDDGPGQDNEAKQPPYERRRYER